MLQEVETITVSSVAATEFKKILQDKNMEGSSLRVYVAGGGCSGVSFGMAIENNVRDNDITINSNEISIVIDDQSINYLKGAHINFINDPQRGAGFIVEGVSTASSCNCGSGEAKSGGCACGSGGHAHDHNDSDAAGGCACGGSCSCN